MSTLPIKCLSFNAFLAVLYGGLPGLAIMCLAADSQ